MAWQSVGRLVRSMLAKWGPLDLFFFPVEKREKQSLVYANFFWVSTTPREWSSTKFSRRVIPLSSTRRSQVQGCVRS